MNKKSIIPVYIITSILIVSLIGCTNFKQIVSPVSPSSDEKKISSNTASLKTYSNARFGFSLSYPDFYAKKTESDNGDGISMESSDKLHTLKIWGGYNVTNSLGVDLLAMAKNRVSYIRHEYADDHGYQLEYGGGDDIPIIFYEVGCVTDDQQLGFIISYPEKEKENYAEIVKQMSDELMDKTTTISKTNKTDAETNTTVPEKIEEFTYSIRGETYTEKGINLKFPQLTKANNSTKADTINKAIQENIRGTLDSLRSEGKDLGALTLDLNYEIAGYAHKVLSISYQGYAHFEQVPNSVNIYRTQNIVLVDDIHTISLKDIFTINDIFIERFKTGMYSPSREDLDLEKSGVNLKEEIERQYSKQELINLFQNAEANYKLTEYGVIVSIEVPHALGDHLEMATNYESIEANMIKGSPVWKDYLFLIN